MGQKTKQKSMLSASLFPPLPGMKNWQLHTEEQKTTNTKKQTISKTTVKDEQVDKSASLIIESYLENSITQ